MPTEQEELRLTVSLVDNASAGIAALKNQIQSLTSGQTRSSFETFKRQQKEMGDQIKDITQAAIGGEKAILGYIGRFGALGLAASAAISTMKSFSQAMTDINNLSKTLGVPAANIKNVVDQMAKFGISNKDAQQTISGLTNAVVELGRRGSPAYADLMAKSDQYSGAMQQLVRRLEATANIEDQINLIVEAGETIRKNRHDKFIEMHRGEMDAKALEAAANRDAAKQEENWFAQLHLRGDVLVQVHDKIKNMTAAQREFNEHEAANAQKVTDAWNGMAAAALQLGDKMVVAFGPRLTAELDNITRTIGEIEGAINAAAAAMDRWQKSYAPGALPGTIQPNAQGIIQPRNPDVVGALKNSALGMLGMGAANFADRWPQMATGGIVNRPTMAMIGEGGPEAVVPLGAGGDLLGGKATEANTRETADNTKALNRLNDQLFSMRGLGGLPGISGNFGGGGGGGGGGAPGGGAPNGSDVGPGTGPGAGETSALSPTAGGSGGRPDYSGKLAATGGGKGDPRGLESYIRQTAAKYGIDPDVAMRVARSEGLANPVGDHGKSGGAFQLYTGGGLGNEFQKETGLNPLDPKNEKATIDYALKHAATSGWGPWHGAARVGIGPRQGIGTAPTRLASIDPNAKIPAQPNGSSVGPGSGAGAGATPASAGGYTGVGGYNFMGSARAQAMGLNIAPGSPEAHQQFATGIKGGGPGSITANKYAGPDMAAFLKDLHDAGAPLGNFAGAYNYRPKRGGRGWSQHAYGNALDIETGFGSGPDNSPALYKWAQEHPEQFAQIQAAHHMHNLTHGDWGHFEWSPTGKGDTDVAANRSAIDAKSVQTVKVDATGKLTANINAPPGTDATLEGGGVFKKIEVNRQVQMSNARRGPIAAGHA